LKNQERSIPAQWRKYSQSVHWNAFLRALRKKSRYYLPSHSAEPKFGQLDAMYGLPYGFTVYGGAIFSDDYYSLAGGLGKNFGYIGAISIDVTQAKSKLANEENSEGQSCVLIPKRAAPG
ncbi:long polar fimbrial outer membrane usher protein LpfC, partial [Salmonella enterica subsp. enterica serovar Heidelberg str. 640151-11]